MVNIHAGLKIVHSDRMERLLSYVVEEHPPLAPLQESVWLTHTQAAAEWMKLAMAQLPAGICTAVRIEMPGSFLWSLTTQVLGLAPDNMGVLEKPAMLWRIFAVLTDASLLAGFPVLQKFIGSEGRREERLYQLARRIADLYDQYTVYRSDWLQAWSEGKNILSDGRGQCCAMDEEDLWQAELWQLLMRRLPEGHGASKRFSLHGDFVQQLREASAESLSAILPSQIVFVAAAAISPLVLDALLELSHRTQVLLLVFNPCCYHWSDIVSDRELFRQMERQRQRARRYRNDRVLADIDLMDMHTASHPLLAAWGQLGRDFMGQLDAYDGADQAYVDRFHEEENPDCLLLQLQQAIRHLLPVTEHLHTSIEEDDDSLTLHLCHSRQRELEVLQDTLLNLLAHDTALTPRDIVVMVPDIADYLPFIQATMNRYDRNTDRRFLPFCIADRPITGVHPLLAGFEQLLNMDRLRLTQSDLLTWLNIPAIAQRFGVNEENLDSLVAWCGKAGLRWGLDQHQRAVQGLGMSGAQNTWKFALERMLAGYAGGFGTAEVAPLDGVQGTAAERVGSLALLLDAAQQWLDYVGAAHEPVQWYQQLNELLSNWFLACDESEQNVLDLISRAVDSWYASVMNGGYTGKLTLSVVRLAVLSELEAQASAGRFFGDGIVFCSLLPLRALPFKMVCLLGMNEESFPRPSRGDDLDLMRRSGQFRLGDRSRVADDRYMLLQAIMSTRQRLYMSWLGLSPLGRTEQPPSLLLGQLVDYLDCCWQSADGNKPLSEQIKTRHPMTAYSAQYFVNNSAITYAHEWGQLYKTVEKLCDKQHPVGAAPREKIQSSGLISVQELGSLLKNPARYYFTHILNTYLQAEEEPLQNTEVFDLDPLQQYQILEKLLNGVSIHRLKSEGVLPLGGRAEVFLETQNELAQQMQSAKIQLLKGWEPVQDNCAWKWGGVQARPEHFWQRNGSLLRMRMQPSDGLKKAKVKGHALMEDWLWALFANCCDKPVCTHVLAKDLHLYWDAGLTQKAAEYLNTLMGALAQIAVTPLALPLKTVLTYVQEANQDNKLREAMACYCPNSRMNGPVGEVDDPYWARLYPDAQSLSEPFQSLIKQPEWLELYTGFQEWCQKAQQLPYADCLQGNASCRI